MPPSPPARVLYATPSVLRFTGWLARASESKVHFFNSIQIYRLLDGLLETATAAPHHSRCGRLRA